MWRAWFNNDREKLKKIIPDEAIAIDGRNPNWENRAAILTSAQKFAESGAKLTRLESRVPKYRFMVQLSFARKVENYCWIGGGEGEGGGG